MFFQLGEPLNKEPTNMCEQHGRDRQREELMLQIKVNYVPYRFSSNPTPILGKALWEFPDLGMLFWKAVLKR